MIRNTVGSSHRTLSSDKGRRSFLARQPDYMAVVNHKKITTSIWRLRAHWSTMSFKIKSFVAGIITTERVTSGGHISATYRLGNIIPKKRRSDGDRFDPPTTRTPDLRHR